ncbi:MAG: hypothetical protein PHH60_06040, partial [Candidatus Margulisbacteria bacterium]|nr:hypothetical protein [Candidatus Margulisiibacteriota bacterium]
GQICATSASGLGGFYGGIALANKIGVSKIPNKGAAGLVTTFFGVMGALGATESFSAAYQNNVGSDTLGFGLKDVVDSKAANYTGQALGAIGESAQYYYGGRLATNVVLKTLAQTGAAEGLGLAGAAGAARIAAWGNIVGLLTMVLTIQGDSSPIPDPYEGKSLADLAQGKIEPITAEDSIYKSHLAFELLLCLYKAGNIKRDMIPGQDQEHWDRFMKIFEGLDLNKPETVKEAFKQYDNFLGWQILFPNPAHTHAMVVDVLAAGIREFKQQAALEGFGVDPEDKTVDAKVANLLLVVADKATQIETENAAKGKVQAALAKIGINDVELGYGVFSLDDLYPFNRSLNSFIQSQRIYRGDFNGFKIAKVTNDGEFSVSIQGEAMTVRLYDDGGWILIKT